MSKKRVIAFCAGLAVLFTGIAVRVGVLTGGELFMAAERQSRYTLTLARVRGTIYDSELTPLTNTGREYRLGVVPTPEALHALATALDKEKWSEAEQRLSSGTPVALAMAEPPSIAKGMWSFSVPTRYGGALPASHLLGYLDGTSGKGVTGVERFYDDLLTKYTGEISMTFTMDGTGEWMQGISPEITDTLSRCRGGVALTLNSRVQATAQRAADRYLPRGGVVICEAKTGQILASVSTPGYQPDRVASLLNDPASPLLNRVLCNYNCGSVFKIVTAATALEKGLPITTAFSCSGRIRVEGIPFRCHHELGHGRVGMLEGFAGSCNPYFIQLADRVGGADLHNMAARLGFNRSVPLGNGWESDVAVLPQKQTLAQAALANLSIGQGELLASPLHIAALVGAVVNDGEWRMPSIFKGEVTEDQTLIEADLPAARQVFSPKTAATLRSMMEQTMLSGTGRAAAPAGKSAAGKTGTAETGWVQTQKEVVQSWFAGYYPADNPRYVIVTLAEDADNTGGNSSLAFRQICEQLSTL